MKKDGIQTRNRKLSAKSKKKRAGMADFFGRGLDGRWAMGMGMGMGSGYSFASPMSGYYHQVILTQFGGSFECAHTFFRWLFLHEEMNLDAPYFVTFPNSL